MNSGETRESQNPMIQPRTPRSTLRSPSRFNAVSLTFLNLHDQASQKHVILGVRNDPWAYLQPLASKPPASTLPTRFPATLGIGHDPACGLANACALVYVAA